MFTDGGVNKGLNSGGGHESIQTQSFSGGRQHRDDRDGGLGQLELGSVGSGRGGIWY
jgi:hypothetical protein